MDSHDNPQSPLFPFEELSLESNFPFLSFDVQGAAVLRSKATLAKTMRCLKGRHDVCEMELFQPVLCPDKCQVCVECAARACSGDRYRCPLCLRKYSKLEIEVLQLHRRGLS